MRAQSPNDRTLAATKLNEKLFRARQNLRQLQIESRGMLEAGVPEVLWMSDHQLHRQIQIEFQICRAVGNFDGKLACPRVL